MTKCSVLYFTGNYEDEKFEHVIIQTIKKSCGDLPIVSVSQKPIDFGYNVCIGEKGKSVVNLFRQIIIGATMVETPFVILTESDSLYPPSYFKFEPNELETFYYPSKYYTTYLNFNKIWPKWRRDISGIIDKHTLIELCNFFIQIPKSYDAHAVNAMSFKKIFPVTEPVLHICTRKGLNKFHSYLEPSTNRLSYWGTTDRIWEMFK